MCVTKEGGVEGVATADLRQFGTSKIYNTNRLLGCSANFVEQNPYETRNTNLISLDVATKL